MVVAVSGERQEEPDTDDRGGVRGRGGRETGSRGNGGGGVAGSEPRVEGYPG